MTSIHSTKSDLRSILIALFEEAYRCGREVRYCKPEKIVDRYAEQIEKLPKESSTPSGGA